MTDTNCGKLRVLFGWYPRTLEQFMAKNLDGVERFFVSETNNLLADVRACDVYVWDKRKNEPASNFCIGAGLARAFGKPTICLQSKEHPGLHTAKELADTLHFIARRKRNGRSTANLADPLPPDVPRASTSAPLRLHFIGNYCDSSNKIVSEICADHTDRAVVVNDWWKTLRVKNFGVNVEEELSHVCNADVVVMDVGICDDSDMCELAGVILGMGKCLVIVRFSHQRLCPVLQSASVTSNDDLRALLRRLVKANF